MKWYLFDPYKGSYQKRPPVKKYVLLQLKPIDSYSSNRVVVGYIKNAAGDKQSPYFVRPGILHPTERKTISVPEVYMYTDVLAWCDCLPLEFEWPKERKINEES